MILGNELGMLVEVVDGPVELTSLESLAVVATAILDAMERDLAASVPVGLML